MTGQSSDEKFRLTYEACQKIYIHDLLEILVGHVFCCKCHLSPEWRVGRLSAGCRWMRCFLAGQSCSADRGQRIYTHITAHNSPIRKNTRFTWKIPTLRGSPSLKIMDTLCGIPVFTNRGESSAAVTLFAGHSLHLGEASPVSACRKFWELTSPWVKIQIVPPVNIPVPTKFD